MNDFEICASCGNKIKKSLLNENSGNLERPKKEHRHVGFFGSSYSYCSYMCCMFDTCFKIEEQTTGKQVCFRCSYVHHWDKSRGIQPINSGTCPACDNKGRV
jgi:hypothetical protein